MIVRLKVRVSIPHIPVPVQYVEAVKGWFVPHRRAAIFALLKAAVLLGALWEYVWLWHTNYYSKRYPELPLSLAWAMLTAIAGITAAQAGCSSWLKVRSSRRRQASATARERLTELLTGYISGADIQDRINEAARDSPQDFEDCVTSALIGTRGAALERIKTLAAVTCLRDTWIKKTRRGNDLQRRYAVERLSLLRDSSTAMALEVAVEEDPSAGVVAAAIRGLLTIPDYAGRERLLESLPRRPYLVRVLTAGETPDSLARSIAASTNVERRIPALNLTRRQRQVNLRSTAIRSPDKVQATCATLATLGGAGRGLLHLMAALGQAGDAPAEALGELLTAGAKGGR
jgi:hypothetical protein